MSVSTRASRFDSAVAWRNDWELASGELVRELAPMSRTRTSQAMYKQGCVAEPPASGAESKWDATEENIGKKDEHHGA